MYGLSDEIQELREEIKRLQQMVDDLQSGMYINCVYCGHRFGPKDEVPSTMADVLKEHVKTCPKHPMAVLYAAAREIVAGLDKSSGELREIAFEAIINIEGE